MNYKIKKLIFLPFLLIFFNLGFILFESNLFNKFQTFLPILIFDLFISLDIVIRPISAKKDQYNRVIPAITFLSIPIIVLLPYLEFKTIEDKFSIFSHFFNYFFTIGVLLLIFGGFILLVSRLKLGKLGGPKIVIEDEHELITNGIYKYIRHPMYLGFLILFFGYSLAFGSIIITFFISISLFMIFKNRMDIEESSLISEFGDNYISYQKKTKRLFPFLY